MTRIFDFEIPDLSAINFIKELLFIKTRPKLFSLSVCWFFLSIFYLFIIHFYTIYLFLTLKFFYSIVFYVTTISLYFFIRILLGYVVDWIE
jgi:hypothetical protein